MPVTWQAPQTLNCLDLHLSRHTPVGAGPHLSLHSSPGLPGQCPSALEHPTQASLAGCFSAVQHLTALLWTGSREDMISIQL